MNRPSLSQGPNGPGDDDASDGGFRFFIEHEGDLFVYLQEASRLPVSVCKSREQAIERSSVLP